MGCGRMGGHKSTQILPSTNGIIIAKEKNIYDIRKFDRISRKYSILKNLKIIRFIRRNSVVTIVLMGTYGEIIHLNVNDILVLD